MVPQVDGRGAERHAELVGFYAPEWQRRLPRATNQAMERSTMGCHRRILGSPRLARLCGT